MRAATTLADCAAIGLAAAIPLGFVRFSYALVLPAMQSDLGLTYAEAGALNSANALGHLLGAILAIGLLVRVSLATAVIVATVLTTVTLAATGLASQFEWLMVWRFMPGFTGAIAFVADGTLAAQTASTLPDRAALGVGLFYAGPGIGVVLAAVLVAQWLFTDATSWPNAWLTMGAATAAAITGWWSILGVGAIAASWIWSGFMLRSRDGTALATMIGVTGLASILPVVVPNDIGVTISFALFGLVFLSTIAATTNLVRIARNAAQQAYWIGIFTVVFGVGQIVGPVATGAIADYLGSTNSVLVVSCGLLIVGAVIARYQRNVD